MRVLARTGIRMRRTKYLFTILFISAGILTGCSLGNGHVKTDQAMEHIAQLDYAGALNILNEAEKDGENKELVHRAMGMAKMGLADYPAAVEDFDIALKASNGRVDDLAYDISYYLATAEYKSGDLDHAIETYSAILAMKPKDPTAYLLRGQVRLEKGLYDDAVEDFNTAISLDSQNPDMYVKIFECMKKFGYQQEGHNYLEQAMELDTKISDFQIGKLYYCLEDYEHARDSLEKARGTEEEGVVLYLGRTYEALGDVNYAASLYKSYLEKKPEDVELCNQLGLCLLKSGDYKGALEAFENGLKNAGSDMMQSLKYNEIVAYEYIPDFKKATVLMESYLENYPDDTAAQREYEFLKTR